MTRRKRFTVSSAVEVGGCLWHVSSTHSDHYVLAPDIEAALATYWAIPEVVAGAGEKPDETTVREVRRVAACVHALPVALDLGDDRSQS